MDYKKERDSDTLKIKDSQHPRKVIVAGPGTGKSFLFQELIKKKKAEGKNNFLAITFIGKLGNALADDLCGLTETMTMHGFARKFFLGQYPKFKYYPRMDQIIREDLEAEGVKEFLIGDENYRKKSAYYKTVGDADVVNYVVDICGKSENKIPVYDLILIDEYQDFNSIESEFVDLLASKNEVVIVGDDDQALYEFKGSSPLFIREKYDLANTNFESHTLRFCSRCTEVIIKYFHSVVERFKLNEAGTKRISKEYICYLPDKDGDSKANPKIHLIKNCPSDMIAYKIQKELEQIVSNQKIKEVLIIGEGRTCKYILKSIASQLKSNGFKNVDYKDGAEVLTFKQEVVDAYKFIYKDKDSLIGWRILNNPEEATKKQHLKNAKVLNSIINGTPSVIKNIKQDAIDDLEKEIDQERVSDKQIRNDLLFTKLKSKNVHLGRPLSNFEITVCNILNSKGLGADVVFLVGFDQGKFPEKEPIQESEIFQLLVAITRAKKRVYLINTISKEVSRFIDCIDPNDLEIEKVRV